MYWLAWLCATAVDFFLFKRINDGWIGNYLFSLTAMDGYLASQGIVSVYSFYKMGEWFLGCQVILYLLFPALYKCVKKAPFITLSMSVVIYVICMDGVPLLNIATNQFTFFLRFPEIILGMLFIKYDLHKKPLLLLGITGAAAIIGYYARDQIHNLSLCILCCSLLFAVLSIVGGKVRNDNMKRLIIKGAGLSYPVFLIHHWLIDRLIIGFDLASIQKRDVVAMCMIYLILVFVLASYLKRYGEKFASRISNAIEGKKSSVA